MRSSKSRSRNKNRNRPSGGNVINRVFDSSGPEGKVRGTPQQVIDKYNQLARDAQLAGDRVATENFQQHSEHYTRLLAQAQKEVDARRDQQQGQGGGQNAGQNGGGHQGNGQQGGSQQNNGQQGGGYQGNGPQGGGRSGSQGQGGEDAPRGERLGRSDRDGVGEGRGDGPGRAASRGGGGGGRDESRNEGRDNARDATTGGSTEVIETGTESGLVETPEARSDDDEAVKPKRRTRRKAPKLDGEGGEPVAEDPSDAAPKPRSRTRAKAPAQSDTAPTDAAPDADASTDA